MSYRPAGFGLQSVNNCFDAPDYSQCIASASARGNDTWWLDVNAFANEAETNPYVVGGDAWRALHPEAAAELDRQRALAAAVGGNAPTTFLPSVSPNVSSPTPQQQQPAASSNWMWGIAIVVGLVLIAK